MSIETKDLVAAYRKQPIGFICGFIAVVAAGVTYWRGDETARLEQRLHAVTTEGNQQQQNVVNASLLAEHLATVRAANTAVADRAIAASSLATNLQYFYNLEVNLGVKLVDLRQGTPVAGAAGSTYRAVPFTVAIEGSYAQVLRFLQELQSGEHLVRFNTITLVPAAARADAPHAEPLLNLSLTVDLLGKS